MRRAASTALVALALLVAAGSAHADPTPQEKILAQSLFDDGRAKMTAGDYKAACPKLAESYRLDPAPGTLLNLGMCHEAEGRLATAYAEISEALSRAIRDGRSERQKTAREHLARIAPRLSKLQLRVSADAPADLHVEVDGVALSRTAWDVAVPMDPGEHTVVAKADGRLPFETKVTVASDGSVQEVAIEPLAIDPNAHKAASPPPPPAPTPIAPAPPPPAKPAPLRLIGFAALGVGGAGLVAGGIFGALAASTWSGAHDKCPNNACPSDAVVADGRRAGTFADVATVSLVVGSVLAAGGLALVFVAPSRRTAWVAPTLAGVTVGGEF